MRTSAHTHWIPSRDERSPHLCPFETPLTMRYHHGGDILVAALLLSVFLTRGLMLLFLREDSVKSSMTEDLDRFPPNQGAILLPQVPSKKSGFPSFADYNGPIDVTYDGRSLLLNGERALFLGGSMHPSRATKSTWELALNEAVRNGLNMATIYIMWSAHQTFPDTKIDWSLSESPGCRDKSCRWDLAEALQAAADRGLFIHVRLGPYDCAEYTYGGIPEWLPLKYPQMVMRRLSRDWLDAMEGFVSETVKYLDANKLWAYQGGPVLLGQIENELGGEFDTSLQGLLEVDPRGNFVEPKDVNDSSNLRNATVQDYADWCGAIAAKCAPNVVWTMCNGLSANNTISTFNGDGLANNWLEKHGDTGRIQVDQPALWTEDEGGFQIWGEEAAHPSDYFWGRTARSMAYRALQWFARGGSHLNYYMWWGGYNRGRSAAAGIMNMYASDAVMCPSGERRHPKFGHFEALHRAIAGIAPVLLNSRTALDKSENTDVMNDDGLWEIGTNQRMFVYRSSRGENKRDVVFVENNANVSQIVKIPARRSSAKISTSILEMEEFSAVLLVDGIVRFDSAAIEPRTRSFERKFVYDPTPLVSRATWKEPTGAFLGDPFTKTASRPIEQTLLNVNDNVSSDYAWYETDFSVDTDLTSATLHVDTQKANGIIAFIDGSFVGAADDHQHAEGNATLRIAIGRLPQGKHRLSIMSESLGYHNLIGRWGGSTKAKPKGISGDMVLQSPQLIRNQSLVDGRSWRSFAGLHGERRKNDTHISQRVLNQSPTRTTASWVSASFETPRYDPSTQALFLDVTTGRGHLYLNGKDLGRYWNITRGNTSEYSQRYYFLPNDFLWKDGKQNELVLFDVFGGDRREAKLVLSWLETTNEPNLMDEVDYPLACI